MLSYLILSGNVAYSIRPEQQLITHLGMYKFICIAAQYRFIDNVQKLLSWIKSSRQQPVHISIRFDSTRQVPPNFLIGFIYSDTILLLKQVLSECLK